VYAPRISIIQAHACIGFCTQPLAIKNNRKSNATHPDPFQWDGVMGGGRLRGNIRQSQRIHEQGPSQRLFLLCYSITMQFDDTFS
jgi:hypothetical protein